MQLRCRSVAWWTVVVAAISLVLAACGGRDGTTEAAGSPTAVAATDEPGSQVDPLEGEWRAEFTCQEMLASLEGVGAEDMAPGFLEGDLGVQPRPSRKDPCANVDFTMEIVVRFAGGSQVLFANGVIGDENTYTVAGDTFTLSGNPDLPFRFQVEGDRLIVDVPPETHPGYVYAWTTAPFERVS
jgi:hypothetical protein